MTISKHRLRLTVGLILGALAFYFFGDMILLMNGLVDPHTAAPLQRSVEFTAQTRAIKITMLCGFAAIAGIWRISSRHPIFKSNYMRWLQTTPWTSRLPLPLGPIALGWRDAAGLGVLMALAKFNAHWNPLLPLAAFLLTYMVLGMVALFCTSSSAAVVLAFALGGVVRAWPHASVVAAILLAMCVLFHGALWPSLRRFPWKDDAATRAVRQQKGREIIAWPFNKIGPIRPKPGVDFGAALLAGALVGWWVYCVSSHLNFADHDMAMGTMEFVGAFGAVAALARFMVYCMGYAPPLSATGRLFTGRLVLSNYDYVFIAPLATLAMPLAILGGCPISSVVAGVATGACLLVALATGPSLDRWRLTGGHRMIPIVPTHRRAR